MRGVEIAHKHSNGLLLSAARSREGSPAVGGTPAVGSVAIGCVCCVCVDR